MPPSSAHEERDLDLRIERVEQKLDFLISLFQGGSLPAEGKLPADERQFAAAIRDLRAGKKTALKEYSQRYEIPRRRDNDGGDAGRTSGI
jgi:hypothetical protein